VAAVVRAGILAAAALVALACAADPAGAVIGGHTVDPATVAYLADLEGCTGTLIAPDRVLTAAHCTNHVDIGDPVRFTSGETRHIARMADDYAYARRVPVGDDAQADPLPFDAGIVQLDQPVTDIAPIGLATSADAALYRPGTRATTIGLGITHDTEDAVGALRAGTVEIHSDRDCTARLSPLGAADQYIGADMLCTTDPDQMAPFVSGCFGDSGGPLVVNGADGLPLEVAIDDWGVFCGEHHGDPENYADAAVISSFALTPDPVWEPISLTRPQLSGTVAVGRTVFCTPPAYADPQPTKLFYEFDDGPIRLVRSSQRRFQIPASLRGERLSCAVLAQTIGGPSLSDASRSTLVTGRAQLHG
jgi:hypothetical protein